jgi:hypothetical protein
MFNNLSANNVSPLKIVDFSINRMFPVSFSDQHKPSCTRINYSVSNYKNKVYFYGGIDEKNKILDTMDDFDATTYKFTAIKYRGEANTIPKGRQGHTAIAID